MQCSCTPTLVCTQEPSRRAATPRPSRRENEPILHPQKTLIQSMHDAAMQPAGASTSGPQQHPAVRLLSYASCLDPSMNDTSARMQPSLRARSSGRWSSCGMSLRPPARAFQRCAGRGQHKLALLAGDGLMLSELELALPAGDIIEVALTARQPVVATARARRSVCARRSLGNARAPLSLLHELGRDGLVPPCRRRERLEVVAHLDDLVAQWGAWVEVLWRVCWGDVGACEVRCDESL